MKREELLDRLKTEFPKLDWILESNHLHQESEAIAYAFIPGFPVSAMHRHLELYWLAEGHCLASFRIGLHRLYDNYDKKQGIEDAIADLRKTVDEFAINFMDAIARPRSAPIYPPATTREQRSNILPGFTGGDR